MAREIAAHGTRARYQKHKCRCAECRAANASEWRKYRFRKAEREGRSFKPWVPLEFQQRILLPHGTRACAKRGCTCRKCLMAEREAKRQEAARARARRAATIRVPVDQCCDACKAAAKASHGKRVRAIPAHGTLSRATSKKHPCKCDECRAVRAAYARFYRQRYAK